MIENNIMNIGFMIDGVLTDVDFMIPVIGELNNDKCIDINLYVLNKDNEVNIEELGYDLSMFDEIFIVDEYNYQTKKQFCDKFNIDYLICASE